MKGRAAILLSGAVGVPLAAPIYILAMIAGGPIIPLPGEAAPVMFVVLLAAALVEMPVMVFALRTLARQSTSPAFLLGLNVVYVSFAGVYAALQVLLFGRSGFSEVLLGLTFVRWLSGWLIVA